MEILYDGFAVVLYDSVVGACRVWVGAAHDSLPASLEVSVGTFEHGDNLLLVLADNLADDLRGEFFTLVE